MNQQENANQLENSKMTSKGNVVDIDHKAAAHVGRSINKIDFPFEEKPEADKWVEIAQGVFGARIPLPWSLNHINVYIFEEEDGWTVVDTGSQGKRGQETWDALLKGPMQGKPVKKVIGTHMHPDHIGLAGWLCEKYDAPFYMTMGEYLTAQTLWLGASEEIPQWDLEFLFRAGVSRSMEEAIKSFGYDSYKKGVYALPAHYERLEDGSEICFGGRRWRVLIGRGHSPEHACLHCLDEPLFLSGDQVLPGITSNVSVYAREPNANPLGHWLASLHRLAELPDDPLVLPSHGLVFKGFKIRCEDLIAGHVEKLKNLSAFCEKQSVTVVESLPAMFHRKLTGFDFFMGLGEALAHINLLVELGVLQKSFDGKTYSYKTIKDFDSASVMQAIENFPGLALRHLSDFYKD